MLRYKSKTVQFCQSYSTTNFYETSIMCETNNGTGTVVISKAFNGFTSENIRFTYNT